MVSETPLTTIILSGTHDDYSWVFKDKDRSFRLWTEPDEEDKRCYINVCREDGDKLIPITRMSGILFVPVTMGGYRPIEKEGKRFYVDMTTFTYPKLSYYSVEYCPMIMWSSMGVLTLVTQGDQSKITYDSLTEEELAEYELRKDIMLNYLRNKME